MYAVLYIVRKSKYRTSEGTTLNVLKKFIGYRTFKTALGAALAVLIAQSLHLDYAVNAGIIVILSVQKTRKKSFDLAVMRIGSTIIALAIGAIVFSIVGFKAVAFGIYLLIFIPISCKLKFNDGIVPCSVLVSHLLASKSVAIGMLGNEMMQMLIGAGIGFILNLLMPSLEKKLEENIRQIDELIQKIMKNMAESLKTQSPILEDGLYSRFESLLKDGYTMALHDAENKLSRERTRYIQYMEIRNRQYEILNYMRRYFTTLDKSCAQTYMVASLTENISAHFNDLVISDEVFNKFKEFRDQLKGMDLPATREEFEIRATLYEYLNDLERLLDVKDMLTETDALVDAAIFSQKFAN